MSSLYRSYPLCGRSFRGPMEGEYGTRRRARGSIEDCAANATQARRVSEGKERSLRQAPLYHLPPAKALASAARSAGRAAGPPCRRTRLGRTSTRRSWAGPPDSDSPIPAWPHRCYLVRCWGYSLRHQSPRLRVGDASTRPQCRLLWPHHQIGSTRRSSVSVLRAQTRVVTSVMRTPAPIFSVGRKDR